MSNDATPTDDEKSVRAVVAALTTDPELVGFLRELAPQWGSSVGKTRSFRSTRLMADPGARCTLRVDSHAAIMLNDAIYSIDGPAPSVSLMRDALLNAQIDEGGRRCVIQAPRVGRAPSAGGAIRRRAGRGGGAGLAESGSSRRLDRQDRMIRVPLQRSSSRG
jgi:hypothetical protein